MLQWPSRAFWRIKTVVFVVLFPILIALAFVALYAGGMRAFGPASEGSGTPLEQAGGLIVSFPMPAMERFPTSYMLINLIVAIGVNSAVWAWLASLTVATATHVAMRLVQKSAPEEPAR